MVAVGEDVGQKTLEKFRRRFMAMKEREREKGVEDPLSFALRLVRETCRSRLNQAWYELAVAARTSPRLRQGIRPVAARYFADIEVLARELLPELATSLGEGFSLLVQTVIAIFDGEAVHNFVLPNPKADAERLPLLLILAASARGRATHAREPTDPR
jgi:hypothetical protein